jgi:hypothetical protein
MSQSGEHPVEHGPEQSERIESSSDRAKDAAAAHFQRATGTSAGDTTSDDAATSGTGEADTSAAAPDVEDSEGGKPS